MGTAETHKRMGTITDYAISAFTRIFILQRRIHIPAHSPLVPLRCDCPHARTRRHFVRHQITIVIQSIQFNICFTTFMDNKLDNLLRFNIIHIY